MENKVHSDQFGPKDMSPWLIEKTESVIKALLRLNNEIEAVHEEPEMFYAYEKQSETIEEKVKRTIDFSLYDLTKIYSFAIGGKWNIEDKDIVLQKGLEKLQVKYGLKEETSIHHDVMEFVETAYKFIQGERAPNRTLLYDALYPFLGKDELFDELDKELELVRDGQKTWDAFVVYANGILKEIEEKYQDC